MSHNSLEDAIQYVDLEVGYSPVLLPFSELEPKKAIKLTNSKYGIYDAGCYGNYGNHRWNIPEEEFKLYRALYILQRNQFYKDLVLKKNQPEKFLGFYHWTGSLIPQPTWRIEQEILPLYFPDGIVIPTGENPLVAHIIANYTD